MKKNNNTNTAKRQLLVSTSKVRELQSNELSSVVGGNLVSGPQNCRFSSPCGEQN